MATCKIKFVGSGHVDVHTLAAEDLAKAGVEGSRKTDFHVGEATEIDKAAADAILADAELFGVFEADEKEQEAPASKEAKAPTAVK